MAPRAPRTMRGLLRIYWIDAPSQGRLCDFDDMFIYIYMCIYIYMADTVLVGLGDGKLILTRMHSFGQQSIDSCYVVRPCKVFCFHAAYHGALVSSKVGTQGRFSLRCLVQFLLKLVWHSSCPCGGVLFFL